MTNVWSSEIDPFCLAVTKSRFPDTIQLGDITKIDGASIPPVDVISGGSCCQNMSVAGDRTGLDGDQSRLFFDMVRIIKEMRIATGGMYPRWVVWENVNAALTSTKGDDFRRVLEEFCKIADEEVSIPGPPKGKWEHSGLIMGNGYSIGWRQLDSQYWGVPQRRRRLFVVLDLGGGRAGQVLFERPGCRRNFTEIREAWQDTAPGIREGVAAMCWDARGNGDGRISPTLTGDHNNRITDYTGVVVFDSVGTYKGQVVPAVTGDHNSRIAQSSSVLCYGIPLNFRPENMIPHENVATTLCNGTNPGFHAGVITDDLRVRRFTPTECASLQGMPKWWCADVPHKDLPEYRMWGNGIALPCALYLMEGIKDVEQEDGVGICE